MNKSRIFFLGLVLTLSVVWAQAQSLSVWADSVTVKADSATVSYLKINMLDAKELYSGFQMTIEVPDGICFASKVLENESGADCNLNKQRFKGLNHALCVNLPSNSNCLKVGCVDMVSNKNFYRGDARQTVVNNLFDIGLIADNSLEDGAYVLKFTDCKMIRSDATYNRVADFTSVLVVTHDDIDAVKVNIKESNSSENMYSVSGMKIKKPLKGQVYISNGIKTVRK